MQRDNRKLSEGAVPKAVLQTISDTVLFKSPEGAITIWNRAAAELFGLTTPEVIGKRAERLIPLGERRHWRDIEKRWRAGESIRNLRAVRLNKQGKPVRVLLTTTISDKRNPSYSEIGGLYRSADDAG